MLRAETTGRRKASNTRTPAKTLISVCGHKQPKDITPEDIRAASGLIIAAHESPLTRYHYLSGLRHLCRRLAEEYGAPKLAASVQRMPRPAPRNVTATDEERDAILSAAKPYLRCWLLLCSDLALRSGTAARIAPEHYDNERKEITFRSKFDSALTLPVTDALVELFAMHNGPRNIPYAVYLPGGNVRPKPERRSVDALRQAYCTLRRRLGLRRITPHDLRRTTAVRTLEVTADLRVVQALLGHRDLPTTLWYLDHRNTPVDRTVLELAKLNARKEPISES